MKKGIKKQPEQPKPQSVYRFGLIYFADSTEGSFPLLETLILSNREYDIVVVGASAENLTKWTYSERVSFCRKEELENTISSKEADFWTAADANTAWNIHRTCLGFKPESGLALYFPETVNKTSGKPGMGELFLKAWFKKVSAFFSPSKQSYAEWKSAFVSREKLLRILQTFRPDSLDAWFHRLSFEQVTAGGFELVEQNKPAYSREAALGFKKGLASYVNWFFIESLKEFRHPEFDFKRRVGGLSRFLFVNLFILCLIGMPILSKDYGITWDERLQYDYAHDIYAYLTTFGEDKSIFDFEKNYQWEPMQYYGSFFDTLTVALVDIFSIENEFELRHFLNALFGVFGLLFAGLIARAITKSWLTAFLAFLFLLLTPSYFGHSMNNPKDIPFATGFFMAVYFMIRFIQQLPRPTFATILFFIMGIGLSISIRAGGILIYPYLLMFAGIRWLATLKEKGGTVAISQIGSYLLYFVIVLVGGWLLGVLFWPFALQDVVNGPITALKALTKVNYTISYETFEGVRTYMSRVPWYYSLKLIALGTPVFILVAALIQLIRTPFVWRKESAWVGMLLFMLFFPPLWAAYKGSMLYNGWRHWFFVYGNLVVIAAWGLTWVIENRVLWIRYAGLALLLLGCGNMTWWLVRTHPNQYVYFNEFTGGLKGAYGYYETDYYSNSVKQAVEWIVKNEDVKSRRLVVLTNNEPICAQYYFDKYTDSVHVEWVREFELSMEPGDYAIYTSRTMAKTTLLEGYFPPKGTIHVIEEEGVPLCAIIKYENQYIPEAYAALDTGNFPAALEKLRKAAVYEPNNEEVWRNLGLTYANLDPKQLDSARMAIERSIELLPENFLAYDVLGNIYSELEQYDTAIQFYEKAIALKINHTNAHYNLGLVLFTTEQYERAAESFENCVKYVGPKPHFYKLYGACLANLGRVEEAIPYLTYAVENSNDPQAYIYLATAYRMKGDDNTAMQLEERARQLQGQ